MVINSEKNRQFCMLSPPMYMSTGNQRSVRAASIGRSSKSVLGYRRKYHELSRNVSTHQFSDALHLHTRGRSRGRTTRPWRADRDSVVARLEVLHMTGRSATGTGAPSRTRRQLRVGIGGPQYRFNARCTSRAGDSSPWARRPLLSARRRSSPIPQTPRGWNSAVDRPLVIGVLHEAVAEVQLDGRRIGRTQQHLGRSHDGKDLQPELAGELDPLVRARERP